MYITKIHKFSWENGIRYWYACTAANKQREGLDFPALGAAQILAHWSEVAECISAQGRGQTYFSICRAEAGDTSILCVCVFSVCCRFCTLFSLWLMYEGVRSNPEMHCRMKMHETYLIIFVWRCNKCVPWTFILKSNTSCGVLLAFSAGAGLLAYPRAMLVTEIGGARPPNEIVLD